MPDADGLWAGRYRRDRVLGRGAMGEVWVALDVVLDRQVAIKSIASGRTDQQDLDRMAREARVAARITHPNAVGVYDLLTVDGRPNLVMEYVEGATLDDLIRDRGRLDPHEVAAIGSAVADALAEAHRLGVVHRDIKPANILITPRGTPKLADFGIARAAGDVHLTAENSTIGTPAYLAPEIVRGSVADARSDIWSLGVTLYAAAEGSSPFVLSPDDDAMVVLGRAMTMPIPAPVHAGALSADLRAMLDRDPARRPSAADVAARLGSSPRTGSPEQARGPAAADTTTRFPTHEPAGRRRRRVVLPMAALVVLAAAVVSFVALHTSSARSPQTRSYRGPSDMTVTGPAGWHRDPSDQSVFVVDYLAPGIHDRHTGDYFRVGVFDRHAARNLGDTAADAKKSVVGDAENGSIVSVRRLSFLGTRAVDVEWTGVNPEQVKRHGIIRVWNSDGITREITVNTTAATWSGARPIFDQLTSTCRIEK